MRRNSFSGPEFSGSYQYDRDQNFWKGDWRQSSSFDHTSGHLAAVLSEVRASDFPKLDIATEQSRAGAAASWMQLMGFKMSAVSPEVADCWDFTEREVRGEVRDVLAQSSDCRETCASKCTARTKVPAH